MRRQFVAPLTRHLHFLHCWLYCKQDHSHAISAHWILDLTQGMADRGSNVAYRGAPSVGFANLLETDYKLC